MELSQETQDPNNNYSRDLEKRGKEIKKKKFHNCRTCLDFERDHRMTSTLIKIKRFLKLSQKGGGERKRERTYKGTKDWKKIFHWTTHSNMCASKQ